MIITVYVEGGRESKALSRQVTEVARRCNKLREEDISVPSTTTRAMEAILLPCQTAVYKPTTQTKKNIHGFQAAWQAFEKNYPTHWQSSMQVVDSHDP